MEWWQYVVTLASTLASAGIIALVKLAFSMGRSLMRIDMRLEVGEERMKRHSSRIDGLAVRVDGHERVLSQLTRTSGGA